jgi:nitrite reductase/ring-hydroxylating ferredoxin subunit/(2Fe-2S) ferredoxin
MGQYDRHVFVCTSGETCPTQGDVEKFVKVLRDGARAAGRQQDVRINKAGCFSQCGHGPMLVVYPEDVWYAGVQESDLQEILNSHIIGGMPVERLRYNPGKPGANKIDVETKPAPAKSAGLVWHRVCAAADVPVNGIKEVAANGVSAVIVNTGTGFVAYQAMCPHEAIPLADGVCDGAVLTCLEHMWQFDVKTGAPMGDAQEGLKGFPVKEEKGELSLGLEG